MPNELTNIPSLSVNKVIENLSKMYVNVINAGRDLNVLPSVMLWGPMGVGKSESIRELAKIIEDKTGKRVVVTDVRLLLFNPVDLRGIPTANDDRTLAVWLKPKIFQMDERDSTINILFLDELSAAPQSVQASAYQITLDKQVGEHKLPRNCIVIAAGNRVTDKSVAFNMPKALANRLMHFDVQSNFDSWNEWAIKSGVNDKVVGFLKFRRDYLMKFDPSTTDLAFATPRSWEKVSNILNNVSSNISDVFDLVSGLVGNGIAHEFKVWCNVYRQVPNIKDIFDGREQFIPTNIDVLFALCSSMVKYAKEHIDDLYAIERSVEYAVNFPPDFSVVLFKDYMYLGDNFKDKLLRMPAFMSWVSKRGKLLDAIK